MVRSIDLCVFIFALSRCLWVGTGPRRRKYSIQCINEHTPQTIKTSEARTLFDSSNYNLPKFTDHWSPAGYNCCQFFRGFQKSPCFGKMISSYQNSTNEPGLWACPPLATKRTPEVHSSLWNTIYGTTCFLSPPCSQYDALIVIISLCRFIQFLRTVSIQNCVTDSIKQKTKQKMMYWSRLMFLSSRLRTVCSLFVCEVSSNLCTFVECFQESPLCLVNIIELQNAWNSHSKIVGKSSRILGGANLEKISADCYHWNGWNHRLRINTKGEMPWRLKPLLIRILVVSLDSGEVAKVFNSKFILITSLYLHEVLKRLCTKQSIFAFNLWS